jgi:tRNA A-37 threonylcarbamoyl transferase component Bud32
MPDDVSALQGLDLDALLSEGLRAPAAPAPAAWNPPSPEELKGLVPGHEIIRLIGRGGMGAVYEARQVDLDRRVALKLLPPALNDDEAFAERFRREAQTMARLRHPNLLSVFEFGQSAAGHLYFSMEYVAGGDLGARMKRGPLSPLEALRLVKELCAALEVAHAHGVIHRDIKPSNILLTADGTVKVADFGIALLGDRPAERLTHTGIAVGTLEYAAPEQAAGTAVDPRSDLYSVGVVCYELLTGRLPRGIFDPPSKVNAAVSSAVDPVVHTAMQNDPDRRYQTAAELQQAIAHSEACPPRAFRRARWAVLGVGLLLLLGTGAILIQASFRPPALPGFTAGPAAALAPPAAKLETEFAAFSRPGADLKPLRGWSLEVLELAKQLQEATHSAETTAGFLSGWIAKLEERHAQFPDEARWTLSSALLLQQRGVTLEKTEPALALKSFQYACALRQTAWKRLPEDHGARRDLVDSLCKVMDGHAACGSPPEQVFASVQECAGIFAGMGYRQPREMWFDHYFGAATATTLEQVLKRDATQKPGVQAAARATLAVLLDPAAITTEPPHPDLARTRERLQRLAE